MAKNFRDLTEAEILALAISLEEEDGRIYGDFADGLRESYPSTAAMFDEMQHEESEHRAFLIDQFRHRFGEHIPLIRRQDVNGFVHRRPVWRVRPLGLSVVRKQAEIMELETRRFYERAIERVGDASTRRLLGDLAATERKHSALAASVGAGISMGFAEALSDDGSMTGRGHPWIRGVVCGVMTAAGGLGHTLPYLASDFRVATTVATIVVAAELAAISYIRHRFMDTPFVSAAMQVALGGGLVFLSGLLIGSA